MKKNVILPRALAHKPPDSWTMTQPLIDLADLGFAWPGQAPLLDIPHFRLERGETLFLKGPSGSGKTTLLGLLGGVQKAQRGHIRLLGQDLGQLSAGARDHFRVDHTGYIFQQFNLLPFLSVRDNVELPCRFSRLRAERARQASMPPPPPCSTTSACAPSCSGGAPTNCRSASSNGSPPPAR